MLRKHPHLRRLVKRCKHCQILFITHPRNACRNDLRCPFGCREAHRKICSSKRSTKYYQTEEGKVKKKQFNDCRKKSKDSQQKDDRSDDLPIDQTTICHIQLMTTMIEGRSVAFKDILSLVRDLLRQHSIDLRKKPMYKRPYSRKQPP